MDGRARCLFGLVICLCLTAVLCDYPCICIDIPTLSVLPYANEQAAPLGRLYKDDCKPTLTNTTAVLGTWITIPFHNQIGYLQYNEYVHMKTCSGQSNVDEIETSTSLMTTQTNNLMSVSRSTSPVTSSNTYSTETSTPSMTTQTDVHTSITSTHKIIEGHADMCPSHVKTDAHLKQGFVGQYGQFCYEFVNWKRAFDGAESHCNVESGTLVSITNQHEQDFIERFLASHQVVEKAWIGLNDRQSEGVLSWTSGVPVTYTNFQTGYNQHSTFTHKNNDCFVINNGGEWVDQDCGVAVSIINFGETHPFICQYNISAKLGTFFEILPDAISVG